MTSRSIVEEVGKVARNSGFSPWGSLCLKETAVWAVGVVVGMVLGIVVGTVEGIVVVIVVGIVEGIVVGIGVRIVVGLEVGIVVGLVVGGVLGIVSGKVPGIRNSLGNGSRSMEECEAETIDGTLSGLTRWLGEEGVARKAWEGGEGVVSETDEIVVRCWKSGERVARC